MTCAVVHCPLMRSCPFQATVYMPTIRLIVALLVHLLFRAAIGRISQIFLPILDARCDLEGDLRSLAFVDITTIIIIGRKIYVFEFRPSPSIEFGICDHFPHFFFGLFTSATGTGWRSLRGIIRMTVAVIFIAPVRADV